MKELGVVMMILPFVGMYFLAMRHLGWKTAVGVFVFTGVVIAWIMTAAYLITGGK